MNPTSIQNSRGKCALISIVMIPIVGLVLGGPLAFTYMALTDDEVLKNMPVWGWALLLVFLIFGFYVAKYWLFYIRLIFDSKPRLVLEQDGITDNGLGLGRIDWEDIQDITAVKNPFGGFINVDLSDSSKYFKRKSALSLIIHKVFHPMYPNRIKLNVNGTDTSADSVASFMKQYRAFQKKA